MPPGEPIPDVELLALDLGQAGRERRVRWPLPWLAQRLLGPGERALVEALDALAAGSPLRCGQVCRQALADGVRYADLQLLAGACELAEGRSAEARELLHEVYLQASTDGQDAPAGGRRGAALPPGGAAIRHLYPALRFIVRITPAQLLPVHPSPYAAGLLYAVALAAAGEPQNALTVLRELAALFGLMDELRVMAAHLHLNLGNVDTAWQSLTHAECAEQDALEFTRTLLLAECERRRGHGRKAAQELGRAVRTIKAVNEQSLWRAELLLSRLYADSGLLLDALRESAGVDPAWLPAPVAADTSQREEELLAQLTALDATELEQQALANAYQVYLPDPTVASARTRKLDISRDPLKQLAPAGLSWSQQQARAQELAEAQAAVARGEPAPVLATPKLSAAALDIQRRIAAAQEWWVTRQPALAEAAREERPQLALPAMAEASQLRFDFRGTRELEYTPLPGELRSWEVWRWAGILFAITATLLLVRACMQL